MIPYDLGELGRLLRNASLEVTSGDRPSLELACKTLAAGTEVFIADLPKDSHERLIAAASRLRLAGLDLVPHIVARIIKGRKR